MQINYSFSVGLDIVMVDLDVYFFKNPIPYLLKPEFRKYDMLVRKVWTWYNTGFYLARSTPVSFLFLLVGKGNYYLQ